MSDEDQGNESKGFLARWSQRKQEAKQPVRDAPAAESDFPSELVAEGEAAVEFDLSSLPKLEELTSTTDITAFLRKGVPEHLRNAALRKSWALDPAIRNYVNPALEYAYDWNTPGGVPGSGELEAGMDVARMVSQIMGDETPAEPPNPAVASASEPVSGPVQSCEQDPVPNPPQDLPVQSAGVAGDLDSAENGATEMRPIRESEGADPAASQHLVRRHGSAKPIV